MLLWTRRRVNTLFGPALLFSFGLEKIKPRINFVLSNKKIISEMGHPHCTYVRAV